MVSVEIVERQNAIILRLRNSELVILPEHVKSLNEIEDIKKFDFYFNNKALINRPARKLFLSWVRKDTTLKPRFYKCVKNYKFQEE
jgi:hypothetical protein